MASDVVMPRLSDSMEEGTVLKWLVEEGGEVKRGEPLVEIETDKANMTYEADTDGTLIEVVAQEGDTLPIGELIARIGEPGEAPAKGDGAGREEAGGDAEEAAEEEPAGEGETAEAPAREEREAATATAEGAEREETPARGDGDGGAPAREAGREAPQRGDGDGRVKASPVARRMARELGVELARLEGTGPGGRIVKADVEAAAKGDGAPVEAPEREEEAAPAEDAAPAEAPAGEAAPPEERRPAAVPAGEAGPKGEARRQELTRLQQIVSRRMAESKATAPDFALSLDVDMSQAVELRKRLKEVSDPAPSFNDMVVKAAANALREFPRVNGAYRDGQFELYGNVNVGVAVAAQDALVVPTVFNADQKSLGTISSDARNAIERVRDKTITPPELSGGTFTVSNLGMFGIERFTAIINPPQASILTVGAMKKKPVVDEESGRIVARETLTLTLVCDHRILYGAEGAQFLARVKQLLERPLSLAL
jgi:pyruvate dehydrogenase E2 component (dihydrolipoamide acetyltransferase)